MPKQKSNLLKKIMLFKQIFLHRNVCFDFPHKTDILIYDAEDSHSFLGELLASFESGQIFLRGEETNIWCLLSAMMTKSFWTDDPIRTYAEQFLRFQKPAVVITAIDNRVEFYQLKIKFPGISFISLQNGYRDLADEFFLRISATPGLLCDYFFSFGDGIGEVYSRYISTSTISHGSIRNNLISKSYSQCNADCFAFVSEWERCVGVGEKYLSYANELYVSWIDFYKYDEELLKISVDWCRYNSKELIILGRQSDAILSKMEFEYFSGRITGCRWSFRAPSDFSSSYKSIDQVKIVVGVGSTLLFEALARGARVGIFNARKFHNFNHRPFDYQRPEMVKGKFWSDSTDKEEFLRVIRYLDAVTDQDWESERLKHTDQVMRFDQGNSRLVDVLKYLVPRTSLS